MAARSVSATPSAALSALSALNITEPDIATSNTTPSATSTTTNIRIPNFPLPRELRDQIYGYLLDGDYTRISRGCDQVNREQMSGGKQISPNAYHFHTNILAVNREIHAETEELLYKKNTFVVVSYQRTSLAKERGELLWVPIVSKHYAVRMKLHSLRIHADPGKTALQAATRVTGKEVPTESYIILAGDIKAFAVSMHCLDENLNGHGVVVVAYPKSEPLIYPSGREIDGVSYEPARLVCQLRDTRYRAMDARLQNSLLAPLASILGMSKKVSFTGKICDPKQTAHLKQVMGPSLICQDAQYWLKFDQCVLAKEVADAAVEYDQLDFSVHLYSKIANRLVERMSNLTEENRADYMTMSPFAEILQTVETFTVEILITLAIGELKLGHVHQFHETFQKLFFSLSRWNSDDADQDASESALLDPRLLDRYHSLASYSYLYVYGMYQNKPTASIAEFVEETYEGTTGPRPYLSHDRAVLVRHKNQGAVITAKHLPLDQRAAFRLPFAPTSFYKIVVSALRPSHYEGYHNLQYLRSMSNRVKREVRNLQAYYGIEQTDFTKF
jgi:hypothetical protein